MCDSDCAPTHRNSKKNHIKDQSFYLALLLSLVEVVFRSIRNTTRFQFENLFSKVYWSKTCRYKSVINGPF